MVAYAAMVGALMRRALNEVIRVPGAAVPGVLAPTIFGLGLTAVFGELTRLPGFTADSYFAFLIPIGLLRPAASPAPRRGSTWPGTSSRAGSTACSPRPFRGPCCSSARSSRADSAPSYR
jgi:hypothetical protein